MGCELDSSGSVYRLSEGTTVPARAMLSVRDTEIATQKNFYLNSNSAAAHYYRQCCIDPSEHCAFSLWPSGGHPAETDGLCGVIILMTTLTGNPPENTHS